MKRKRLPRKEMCWDGGWDDNYSSSHTNLDVNIESIEVPWWKNIF